MKTKDSSVNRLEDWRDRLNSAIIQSDFDLSDPKVVDLSGRVDVLVLDEMKAENRIAV